MVLLVLANVWAFVWLFLYAHWFSKLRRGELAHAQSMTSGAPPADLGLTRIESDAMCRAASGGLRSIGTILLFTLIALTNWFPTKRPLSTWELLLVDENILICLLLVVLMARLERIRRLYRSSEQPAFVTQH
jgi:hypothetical protein